LAKGDKLTQEDLRRIRSELSAELEKMPLAQRKEYLKAAEKVYDGLSTMAKIRHLTPS
jgi:hypothetical protein